MVAKAESADGFLRGFEERWTDAKGVRMRAFVAGDGPPIVLVHGLSGAASNFAELAPLLARRRRVLVPELPGHGRSDALPAAPNLNAYADRVRLVAEREGFLPAPLVGHSLGGSIALRLALRAPDDVPAVVLAGSAGIASSTRWAKFWLSVFGMLKPGRRVAPLRRLVARHPPLRYPVFGHWGAADPPALSPLAVEGLMAGAGLYTDTISAARALVVDDPRIDLQGVRCPCLVVWGARDRQVPIDDGFEYARRLGARFRAIADCGHLLVAERADACAHAIEEFLDPLQAG